MDLAKSKTRLKSRIFMKKASVAIIKYTIFKTPFNLFLLFPHTKGSTDGGPLFINRDCKLLYDNPAGKPVSTV